MDGEHHPDESKRRTAACPRCGVDLVHTVRAHPDGGLLVGLPGDVRWEPEPWTGRCELVCPGCGRRWRAWGHHALGSVA